MSQSVVDASRLAAGSRRQFITASATVGAGLLAAQAVGAAAAGAQTVAPSSSAAASAAAGAAGPKALKMSDVFTKARESMFPICRVCPQCDGVACAGEVPGIGGFGSGASFRNNYTALQHAQLKMRVVHDVKKPDLTVQLFGMTLALPAVGAPTGGTTYNMGGKMTEEQFAQAIVGGCAAAGTLGALADGIGDPLAVFEQRMSVMSQLKVRGIVGLKPRTQDEIIARMRKAEEAGAAAFTIDIDSAGRAARALPGQTVEPKTVRQLRELVAATKLPVLPKGIMTVDEALMMADAGVAGFVVSNHGGRVLDHTPGTAEVLPAIADKVKGQLVILVDGCVRYGHDVLKYQALGADAVMVGRHFVRAAHGGGAAGVALFVKTLRDELEAAMTLTGTASARRVPRSILA